MEQSEQEEILYRLDERTEYIQENIEKLDKRVKKHDATIQENQERSRKNAIKISAFVYIGCASLTAILMEVTGLFPL